tara:strand:- start:1406 stop:2077 length:672 start_codon:yes stop_codon:yes gene_type:complete
MIQDNKEISMKTIFKQKEFTKGSAMVIAGLLLLSGTVLAASFSQPGSNFPAGNTLAPIQESSQDQSKAGGITANNVRGYNLKGTSEVCIGNDCRSSWPTGGGSTLSTNCALENLILEGDPHGSSGAVKKGDVGSRCDNILGSRASEGWVNVAHDKCPGVQGRDCAGTNYCQYFRINCASGVTFSAGDHTLRDTGSGSSGGSNGGGGGDNGTEGDGPNGPALQN